MPMHTPQVMRMNRQEQLDLRSQSGTLPYFEKTGKTPKGSINLPPRALPPQPPQSPANTPQRRLNNNQIALFNEIATFLIDGKEIEQVPQALSSLLRPAESSTPEIEILEEVQTVTRPAPLKKPKAKRRKTTPSITFNPLDTPLTQVAAALDTGATQEPYSSDTGYTSASSINSNAPSTITSVDYLSLIHI